MEHIVTVSELKKTYAVGFRRKKVHALKGISFKVRQGEIFGIIGPNGAGKTTTMKILTGLMTQTSGEATLFGEPCNQIEIRKRIGYLPENPYFYDHLKPTELLHYYGRLHGMTGKAIAHRTRELLTLVGLDHAKDRALKNYSKGMRQRAGVAQALINDPDLVILDEPQSGLDPIGRREIRELIFSLKQQGKTVIFSSHILPDVQAVCDRVMALYSGQIRHLGGIDDIASSARHMPVEVIAEHVGELDFLDSLQGVRAYMMRGDKLVLTLEDKTQLQPVIHTVYERGGTIYSINPHQHALEDLLSEAARP